MPSARSQAPAGLLTHAHLLQDDSDLAERAGPLAEIEFWRLRTVDLGGIRDQLDDKGPCLSWQLAALQLLEDWSLQVLYAQLPAGRQLVLKWPLWSSATCCS